MIAFDNVQKFILQLPFSGLLPTFESYYFLNLRMTLSSDFVGVFDVSFKFVGPYFHPSFCACQRTRGPRLGACVVEILSCKLLRDKLIATGKLFVNK